MHAYIIPTGFRPGNYIVRVGHYQGRFTPAYDKVKNIDNELKSSNAEIVLYMGDDETHFRVGSYGYLAGEFWNVFAIDGTTKVVTECNPILCPSPAVGDMVR
jgi:hypothetical protein